MVLLYRLKRRRVQFFPFDAADWARDLNPWLVPLRSAWDWMRAAALPVIWLFDITHLRRVLYKRSTDTTINPKESVD